MIDAGERIDLTVASSFGGTLGLVSVIALENGVERLPRLTPTPPRLAVEQWGGFSHWMAPELIPTTTKQASPGRERFCQVPNASATMSALSLLLRDMVRHRRRSALVPTAVGLLKERKKNDPRTVFALLILSRRLLCLNASAVPRMGFARSYI